MDREQVTNLIRENIGKINVGDAFNKEVDLYNELGLEGLYNANTRKTIKRYVERYLSWEKTGTLNDNGRPSNEIVITSIIDNASEYTPEDGRINNGGAHNVKYGPAFQAVLYHYFYPTSKSRPYTVNDINYEIYKIEYPDFRHVQIDKYEEQYKTSYSLKNLERYYDALADFIYRATKSAFESLEKKGYITYTYDYHIEQIHTLYEHYDLPTVMRNTLLIDFIRAHIDDSGESIDALQDKLTTRARRENKHTNIIDIRTLTLMNYIKNVGNEKDYPELSVIKGFCYAKKYHKKKSKKIRLLPDSPETQLISDLQQAIRDAFGFNNTLSRAKFYEFYQYCQEAYTLLGWEKVYRAFIVMPVKNKRTHEKALTEYPEFSYIRNVLGFIEAEQAAGRELPIETWAVVRDENGERVLIMRPYRRADFDKDEEKAQPEAYKAFVTDPLLSAFEQSFGTRIANMHDNMAERNANRNQITSRDNPTPARGTMPEQNDYYMANDPIVNMRHRNLFNLFIMPTDYPLRRYIRQQEPQQQE